MRHLTVGLIVALMSGGIVSAAQNDKPTSGPKVKADNGSAITLTGCLTIGGATNLMLTNITAEREQENRRTTPAATYALVERDGVELAGYINQKVQLTGIAVPAATGRDRDDKFTVKGQKTVKVARGAEPQFIVASVKPVAPGCQ
jgi:hypothetical protein